MAEITAQAVNEFRKRTGLGLMECKTLLKEAGGDMKKAETLAKERGLKKAADRAGRAAKAGRIEVAFGPEAKSGALIELNCETDFVARNDEFRQTARDLAEHVLKHIGGGALLEQQFAKDPTKTINEVLVALNARTGENVSIARAARFALSGPGRIDAYIHHDSKSGAIIELTAPDDITATSETVKPLAKDLALHVVAKRPICVKREEVPADVVVEQKRIFVTQVADKPENIREKIAGGKLDAWFAEVTLLDQTFVKDETKKVRDVIASAGKGVAVARFARFVVGEAAE
jgi:elongation factor Ts